MVRYLVEKEQEVVLARPYRDAPSGLDSDIKTISIGTPDAFVAADLMLSQIDLKTDLMNQLSKAITQQIDQYLLGQLSLGSLHELEQFMVDNTRFNDDSRLNGWVGAISSNRTFKLSWKKDFGSRFSKSLWEKRLLQFRPTSYWTHSIDYRCGDATFTFMNDEDRVAFLMLMA